MDLNLSVVPTTMSLDIQDLGDMQAVLMLIGTPVGISGYFLSDEQAIQEGNRMLNMGMRIKNSAKSRLTVVERPGIVVPGGHDGPGSDEGKGQ